MYIQDTITMDILNPKETIKCRPGAPIYPGPLFTTGPPVLPQATPPCRRPCLMGACSALFSSHKDLPCISFTNVKKWLNKNTNQPGTLVVISFIFSCTASVFALTFSRRLASSLTTLSW